MRSLLAVDTSATVGAGIDAIHVWAYPTSGGSPVFLGVGTYGLLRPGVGTALYDVRFTPAGYTLTVNPSTLPTSGTYDLVVYGRSTVTAAFAGAAARVTVQ